MFKTHLAFSFLCAILVWPVFVDSGIPRWFFLIIFIFTSLLPDIDTTSSFLGKRFKIVGWIFGHRGLFHSLFPFILIVIPVYLFFGFWYASAVFLGCLSHLVLDMLNHQGVGLFFPLLKWRIKGFCKSGGLFEKVLFIICIAGVVVVIAGT